MRIDGQLTFAIDTFSVIVAIQRRKALERSDGPTCQLDVDLHFTWSVAIVDDTKSNIAKLDSAALKFPDDRAYDSRDGIWINGSMSLTRSFFRLRWHSLE